MSWRDHCGDPEFKLCNPQYLDLGARVLMAGTYRLHYHDDEMDGSDGYLGDYPEEYFSEDDALRWGLTYFDLDDLREGTVWSAHRPPWWSIRTCVWLDGDREPLLHFEEYAWYEL